MRNAARAMYPESSSRLMKRNSRQICGRKTTTEPTPATTPLASRSLRSPGGNAPETQLASAPTTHSIQPFGISANQKMLTNNASRMPTKISGPQIRSVTTRSTRSDHVSPGGAVSVVTAIWMAAARAYRASMAALRQSVPAASRRARASLTRCRNSTG